MDSTFGLYSGTFDKPQQVVDLLQAMIDASPNLITYCEASWEALPNQPPRIIDFIYRLANQAIYDLVGLPAPQVIGERMTRFFPSVKAIGLFDRYAQAVETGQAQRFEFHYQADGYDGWFLINATPMLAGFVLSFTDITQQKRKDVRLQAVIDQAHTAIVMLRPVREQERITDFVITLVNQAQARYVGQTPQTLVGTLASHCFGGYKENGLFDHYCQVADEGVTKRFEFHYQADGIDAWLDIQATPLEGEVLVTFFDYTAVKQVQLQLQQQARLLEDVLAASPASIALMKPRYDPCGTLIDFTFSQVNQALSQLTGQPLAALVGQSVGQLFPYYKEGGLFDHYKTVFETGQPDRFETAYYADGVRGWFDILVAPQADGIVINFVDITLLKALQGQLEAKVAELNRANDNLQQFAYIASHDLQEPLRKIQSFGDLLSKQYADQPADGLLYLARMQSAAARMSRLIRDLLTYSRLGTVPSTFKPIDLTQVMANVLETLELRISETGARVEIDTLPTVRGDALQLEQLFENLVSNALKFSKPTPRVPLVKMRSQRVAAGELPSAIQPSRLVAAYHRIEVVDEGIGFDPTHVDRIFQVFQRLHGKEEYVGTGIGLAICQKVALAHGGGITATSQPGQGATFQVYLPI